MKRSWSKRIKLLMILAFLIFLMLACKILFNQRFDSPEALQEYMKRFGVFAPLVLILFQAFQVVVPVFPGYLGCAAGAVAFGPATGFWCNYIGICAGSIIAYFLARRFGMDLVLSLFSEKMFFKWRSKIARSRSYAVFLFVATLLPLFPDDFLCYFSGLIKMNKRQYIWIILLGKPWCILAYSIIFGMIKW